MKRLILSVLLFCCGILLPAQTAADLELFKKSMPWQVHQADSRGQSFEATAEGVTLVWSATRHHCAELHLRKPQALPPFSKAVIFLKFNITANASIARINLRLVDKTGEVFQFNRNLPPHPESGEKTIDYLIDTVNLKAGSWGGNKDKKLDFPVSILGFSVDFRPNAEAGEIQFTGLELSSENQVETGDIATGPVANFSNADAWRIHGTTPRGQTLEIVNLPGINTTALRVDWDMRKFRYLELFTRKPVELPAFRQATFRLTTWVPEETKAACFCLRLIDKTGEIFQFAAPVPKRKTAGMETIEYVINADQLEQFSSRAGNNDKQLDFPVSLLGISIDFAPNTEKGEAFFVSLSMSGKDLTFPSTAELISLDVETGNSIRVLHENAESKVALIFRNNGTERYQGEVEVEFENFFFHSFKKEIQLNLAPNEQTAIPVAEDFSSNGIWYVRARLHEEGRIPTVLSRSFARFTPTGPTPGKAEGFYWSVSSHSQTKPIKEQKLEALAAALIGVKVVREDAYWSHIQPKKGEWRLDRMDQTVGIFEEQGIETQTILSYCAPWAALNEEHGERSEPEPQAWAEFCRKMAEYYRGRIRFYEVWNEPDLIGFARFSPEAYGKMMLSAYKEIKAVDPEAFVLTGGYATLNDHPSLSDPKFQEKTLVLGRGGYDIHAYHEHGPFTHYYRIMTERFLPMRKRTDTTVPWWANETALTSAGGKERLQAEAVYKKLIYAWANGAIGYTWYDLRNDGYNPENGEHNYGMITKDFYPKAVYPAYNALVQVFRDAHFVREFPLEELNWAFLFQKENDLLVGSWSETDITLSAILLTDAQAVERIDLMGNVSPFPVANGQVMMETSRTPFTLRFKNATKVEFSNRLFEIQTTTAAIPGEQWNVNIKINNPSKRAEKYNLTIHAPAGFLPDVQESTVTVPANADANEFFQFTIAGDIGFSSLQEPDLTIQYQSESGLHGSLKQPIVCGLPIPAGEFDSRPADFTLNQRAQLVELYPADPFKKHLLWKGEQDLSGNVWIGIFDNELNLRVRVTDDIHVQPRGGRYAWRRDNVQFLLHASGSPGYWEFGLTRLENGQPEVWCWHAPNGEPQTKEIVKAVKLTVSRIENMTFYDASIPLSALEVSPEMLKSGLHFNLLINDNDGEGRESWLQIAPGIGIDSDPRKAPLLLFR